MDPAEVRKTRLRIAFRTGSTPPDQNSVFPSGEVEDYLIELRVPQCDQMIPVAYTVYGTNIMPYCNEYTDRKIRMLQNRLPRGFGRIATRVKKAVSRRYGRGRAVSSWYASKENYDLGTKMDPAPVSPAFTGAFDPKWFSVANDLQEVDPGQHVFQDLKMDIYYPESVEGVTLGDLTASPVIIYLPGGTFAWNMRQTELTDKTCEWLASSGYVVAAIDYRTGIHVEDEEAAKRAIIRAWQDSQAAVKWWRMPQNHVHQDADGELLWKIDPDKIYIMGHGAGGVTAQLNVHLAKSRLNTEIGTIGDPGTLWAVGDMYDLNGSNTYDLRQHPVIPCITLSNGTNTCDVVGNDPGNASGGYFTNHADQPLVQSALDTYLALDGRAQRSVSLAGGILETDWLLNDPIRPSLLVHHEDDAVIRNQTAALDVRNYGDIIATDVVTLSGSGAMNSAWMSGAGSGTLLSLELSNAEESITSGGGRKHMALPPYTDARKRGLRHLHYRRWEYSLIP